VSEEELGSSVALALDEIPYSVIASRGFPYLAIVCFTAYAPTNSCTSLADTLADESADARPPLRRRPRGGKAAARPPRRASAALAVRCILTCR